MNKYIETLNQVFGYPSFRGRQAEIVESIGSGIDTIAVMATGAGKSICFQIPAILCSGITIVITPLISLMIDQVRELKNRRIKAGFINSNQDYIDIQNIYLNLSTYKLLYVSPERLSNLNFLEEIKRVEISQIVIDEAHCISMWAHDFRKSYLDIKTFINELPKRPTIACFTATANDKIIKDISLVLELKNPNIINVSADRENLYYGVVKAKNKFKGLIKFLLNSLTEKTLIYVLTRKMVEELSDKLRSFGFEASSYHGGMEVKDKSLNQANFTNGNSKIMVATNAFGMGINIPDIRNVILYEMPICLEDLSQEWGRAARDNLKGKCLLFYDEKDIKTAEFLLESDDQQLSREKRKSFGKVLEFSNTKKCLHNYLNSYFGYSSDGLCHNCSNCK